MRAILALIAFAAVAASASAQGLYRIQPGDTIEVMIAQEPDLNRSVVVRPDGHISFPLAGDFGVEGMSLEEVGDLLGERLATYYRGELEITTALASTGTPQERPLEAAGFRCLDAVEVIEERELTDHLSDLVAEGLVVGSTRRGTVTRRSTGCTHWQLMPGGS